MSADLHDVTINPGNGDRGPCHTQLPFLLPRGAQLTVTVPIERRPADHRTYPNSRARTFSITGDPEVSVYEGDDQIPVINVRYDAMEQM